MNATSDKKAAARAKGEVLARGSSVLGRDTLLLLVLVGAFVLGLLFLLPLVLAEAFVLELLFEG